METTGIIFDIQRFCLHDGPGIRTVLFMKGCPLSCLWCCNPESQCSSPELMFYNEQCIGCGACATICQHNAIEFKENRPVIDRGRCVSCGDCAANCPANALRMTGKEYTVAEVLEIVLKDRLFFEMSGGGVTISGGEPLMQSGFVSGLLAQLKQRGIHTAIETCGFAEWSRIEDILEHVDLFLFDIKHLDSSRHEKAAGVANEKILENFERLTRRANVLTIRVPVIPNWNSDEEHLRNLVTYAADHGMPRIEFLPYHRLGAGKYAALGRSYLLADLDPLDPTVCAAMCDAPYTSIYEEREV